MSAPISAGLEIALAGLESKEKWPRITRIKDQIILFYSRIRVFFIDNDICKGMFQIGER
jgi:hypothetical protein